MEIKLSTHELSANQIGNIYQLGRSVLAIA